MNPSMHDQPVVVIGVDTHKQTHTAAAVEAATGGVVEQATASADPAGYQRLLDAADRATATVGAGDRLWAIEGAGSYGAGLTRWLTDRGEVVVEMERPKRPARRHGAKSDAIDAVRAAREALGRPDRPHDGLSPPTGPLPAPRSPRLGPDRLRGLQPEHRPSGSDRPVGPCGTAVQGARSALDVWRGEPMPEDSYAEWVQPYRDHLERSHQEAIELVATAALANGGLAEAADLAAEAVARRPLRQTAHRLQNPRSRRDRRPRCGTCRLR